MPKENKIHLLKGEYTVKIEGDRALFFVEGETEPIENYAVGEVIVDGKKEKYHPVPNPNDELALFNNKTHDLLEELLKGRVDGLLDSPLPFINGAKMPIKFLNEELGYKMRKNFIQKLDGLKECFALYIQNKLRSHFLFTDGSCFGGYQSQAQVQTFSTIEEAEEKKQYFVSEFNRINALYKKFQEELKEKGVDEDSHEASEICDASEFGKEFEKIKIDSFLMQCADMEFINHGFRNGDCIKIAQVMRKENGDVFNI